MGMDVVLLTGKFPNLFQLEYIIQKILVLQGLEIHVFWGMKKLVQLKIVHHKVSAMLYSVQNLKIRASEG